MRPDFRSENLESDLRVSGFAWAQALLSCCDPRGT